LSSDGGAILEEDEDSGLNQDSRVGHILPAGDYVIEATSSVPAQTGSYTLSLAASALATLPNLNRAQRISGNLSSTDIGCPLPPATYSDIYQFNLASTQSVTIDLKSTAFDAYLFLLSSDGSFLFQDDETGGNGDARISATLPAGMYLVVATSFSLDETGDYTLSIPFSITNNGGVSLVSSGTQSVQAIGYATLQPSAGMTAPSGVAIFGATENGVLVSEAGVPATGLILSGRIYAETGGGVRTGLAMANPNNQDAVVSFSLMGPNGILGSGTTILAANGQIARFTTESPFNLGSGSGTLTFNSSVPISVIALRGLVNERSEFLMTTLPVTDLNATPGTAALIFPEFADGDGWTTQIVLVNPTNSVLAGSVKFLDAVGQPVAVSIGGQSNSIFNYSIPGGSTQKLQTSGIRSSTMTGSVRVEPSGNTASPSGLTIFSRRDNGITVSETGVSAAPSGNAFRLYAEVKGQPGAAGSIQTGVAMVNNSGSPAAVTFELYNLDGSFSGMTGTWNLPANGQDARFLNEISGFSALPASFQGILRVSSRAPVSVLGLRGRYNERREFLSTTTPPSNEASPPSTSPLHFPEIADSQGYTTQFILFSGQANQSTSGTLQMTSPVGAPLNLTLY
jgi:hypothetical protein